MVTRGSCAGQWRNVTAVASVPGSSSLLNITVSPEWSVAGGVAAAGLAGEARAQTWHGCPSPDSTSTYSLLPRSRPPGSLTGDGTFATRWAGFLQTPGGAAGASAASVCQYTFKVDLSRAAANQERVKLWVDNSLVIDQWTSLGAFGATNALLMSQNALYKVQVLYKRGGVHSGDSVIVLHRVRNSQRILANKVRASIRGQNEFAPVLFS